MIQITNGKVSALIHEKGAELQSLQLNWLEYVWQADTRYWGKHSPVLFPVIGELKDGEYIFEEKKYLLPRHGFARDMVFESKKTSDTSAIFTLHSNKATLEVYPFPFIFQVEYTCSNNALFCSYLVKNPGDRVMYFSVGGHPAFKVPLAEDLQYTDYALQFDRDVSLEKYLLHNGLTGDDTRTIPLINHHLPLQQSLFYDDAIVLKQIVSRQIKLFSNKDPHGLSFRFEGFPYFGIWAAKDAPFVCLEPWCGIADSIHHDYQLSHKEGINRLDAGENWQRTWSVELF